MVSNFEAGVSRSSKVQSYHSIPLFFHAFSSILRIALIVYNVIYITLLSFKSNINHLSLPLTKNFYNWIENRKYCRLKICIWSQSTQPTLFSTPKPGAKKINK